MYCLEQTVSVNCLEQAVTVNCLEQTVSVNCLEQTVSANCFEQTVCVNFLEQTVTEDYLEQTITEDCEGITRQVTYIVTLLNSVTHTRVSRLYESSQTLLPQLYTSVDIVQRLTYPYYDLRLVLVQVGGYSEMR